MRIIVTLDEVVETFCCVNKIVKGTKVEVVKDGSLIDEIPSNFIPKKRIQNARKK